MTAKNFSNNIRGLEDIDKQSLPSNDQATVDVIGEASIIASDVAIQLKPTIDTRALKDATEQVEKQVAYINKLASSAGAKVEIGKKGSYTSSTGYETINKAIDAFRQNPDNGYVAFNEELKKQVEQGRKKSGSEVMRKAAAAAAKQFNTLTIDVENTFKEGGITGDILSVSSKHSQDNLASTLIRTDYKKLIASNIKYWANSGNQANVELLKQVESGLDLGASEARSGNPSYKLVNASQMRSGVVATINNNPSAVLQGVNFSTDIQKLVNFIGTKSKASTTASNALLGGVSLDKDFMKYFGLNDFTPGRSVTHMADLLGLLPKVSRAHEGSWDVEVTEQIGAVIHSLNEYEKILATGGTSVPPVVASLKNRLSQPTVRSAYQGRVIASSALQHLNQISLGNITTTEDAEEKAYNLVSNVSAQSVGKLVDFTSPEYSLPATSISNSQKGLVKQQLAVSKAKVASNDLFDISPDSEGLEKYAMLQAATLVHQLSGIKFTDKRTLSPDDQVGVVSDALYSRLNSDFSHKLRNNNGQIHAGVSEHIDLDKIVSSVDSLLVNNGKFTTNASGVGTPDATAFIVNAVKNTILRSINSDLKVGGIDNIALDKTDSSLPKEVFPIQEARKGVSSTSRNVGLKAVSKFILSKIGTNGELSLSSDKLVSETRRHIKNGFFELDEKEELSKPTTDNINAFNAYKDYNSKINMARGSNYENTSAPIDYLAKHGYNLVKPREVGENAEYEHSGILGQMEGHPDLLASRVVPKLDGSLERRYLLPDIKSPNKLPKSFSDVENSSYSREWIAQIVSYAQMLPESIRNFLDIGILAGKPNEPGSEILVTKPYSELVKNPVWATLVEELHKVKVGSAAHLTSLPNNMLPAGPVLSADITADEQNNVNRLANERNDVGPKYVEKLTNLANKREGVSQGSLIHEYTKQNVTGGNSLKSAIDGLYNEHIFGPVSKDQFASNSLSLLLEAINVPKNERKNTILDKLTSGFSPNETIQSRLVGLEIQEKSDAQPKISKITNEQLRKYFDKMSNSINEFWAGAFASDELQGRKISNKYAKTLNADVASPASSPGALSFEDAERRARIEKSLLAGYNRADLDAQNLVFSAEAKKAAIGTSGDSNYLHTGIAPSYSKKSTDGEITYADSMDNAMQRKSYYGSQLELFKGSSSTFDILNKLKTKEADKSSTDISQELNRVLQLLDTFNQATGENKGNAGFHYERAYNRLKNFGNDSITNLVPEPSGMFSAQTDEFTKGYNETGLDYINKKLAYSPAEISSDYIGKIKSKQEKLSLDARLNRHIANYAASYSESNLGIVTERTSLADKQDFEAEAIADFIQNNQPKEQSASFKQLLESALIGSKSKRITDINKLQNNGLNAYSEAKQFNLTTENFSQLSSAYSGLYSLGIDPRSKGLNLSKTIDKSFSDFSGSKSLQSVLSSAEMASGSGMVSSDYFKSLESYVASLQRNIASLNSTSLDPVVAKFKELAIEIESDTIKLAALNNAIDSAKIAGIEPNKKDITDRDTLRNRVKQHSEDLKEFGQPEVRLSYQQNREFTKTEQDTYKPLYLATKADRLGALHDKAAMLTTAVKSGDLTTTDDILSDYTSLHKQYSKIGEKPLKGSLSLSDIIAGIGTNDLGKAFGIEGGLSHKGATFLSAAQTLNNPKADSGVNKFDLLISKENAALSAAKELETKFLTVSNPDLGGLEKEFIDLLRAIDADTAALHRLEEAKKASGENITPIAQKTIDTKKATIQSNLDKAYSLQEEMSRPNAEGKALSDDDWAKQVNNARVQRKLKDYETDARAIEVNSLIAASQDSKTGRYNATYREFEEAIRLAKDRESRGLASGEKINKGFYSSVELEELRGKSGSKGQQHLSFAEGLVDQAAWKVQFGGAGAVLGGISALTIGGFGQAKQFEADMKNVELVSQASSVQLDQLKQKVVELSSTFQSTPSQLSEGLVVLGQAGYKAAESLQLLGPIAQLATATMSDLKQAADITTTVLMSFDEPVSNVAAVTNTLAAATIESKLELSSLGTVLNYVASTAYMAGMSLEETETAMGLMSNAGVKASTIGTSMRSIFGSLISPTAAFKNELARVGLSANDVNPQLHSMSTILQRLSFKGFNVENAFSGLDKRIAGNIATLLTQADKWENFQSKITGTDTASVMAIGQMDTFDAQSKRMSNNFNTARIAINAGAMDPLKDFASGAASIFSQVEKAASTSMGRSTVSFLTTISAAASAAGVITGLAQAGKSIVPAAFAGTKAAFASKLVGNEKALFNTVPKFSQESSLGKWLTTPPKTGNLSSSQQRMHDTVSSLAGSVINPYSLAIAGAITGGYYANEWRKNSDYAFIGGKGLTKYNATKRMADNTSSYADSMRKVAEQETRLMYFDRGTTSSSMAIESGLLATGLYAGRDITGKLVTASSGSSKDRGKITLATDRSELSLATTAALASDYDKNIAQPKLIAATIHTGAASYGSVEDASTDEGRQYIESTSDLMVSNMKAKGIFYNDSKVGKYVAELLPGNDYYSRETKKLVLAKQEAAKKAPDAVQNEQADLSAAYSSNLDLLNRQELHTNSAAGKKLSAPEHKIAASVPKDAVKNVLSGYLSDKEFKKLVTDGGAYSGLYAMAINKFQSGNGSADELANIIKVISGQTKNNVGKNATKDFTNEINRHTTVDGMAKTANELASIGEDLVLTSPKDILDKDMYSTARATFIKDNILVLHNVKTAQQSVKKATQYRDGIKDKSSKEYKDADKRVIFEQAHLDKQETSALNLAEKSLMYSLPNVDSKHREFLGKTRGALGAITPQTMFSLGSGQYADFASKIDKLTVEYRERANNDIVKGSEPIRRKLQLQYELEVKELTDSMIVKNNENVTKYSDLITKALKTDLETSLGSSSLQLDMSKLNIDIDSSNITSNMMLGNRTTTAGYTSDYVQFLPGNGYKKSTFNNSGGLDIAGYSSDTTFLVTAEARANKLRASLVETLSSLNTTKESLSSVLSQDKAGISNFGQSDVGLQKLLDAEEKYTQGRISANQKAFGAIKQIINEELQLREQLVSKIAKSGDAEAEMAKSSREDTKSLLKSAGYDTSEDPQKLLESLKAKEQEYNKRVAIGDVEGAKTIRASMRNEEFSELKTDKYAPVYKVEASKISERMAEKEPELMQKYRSNLQTQLVTSNDNMDTARTELSKVIMDSIELAKTQGSISAEKATIYKEKFSQHLEAASGNPELMSKVISEYNSTPLLQTKIGESLDPSIAIKHLGTLVEESSGEFANLKQVTQEVINAFKDLTDWVKTGGKGTDVTPDKSNIKSVIGETAFKELGLDSLPIPDLIKEKKKNGINGWNDGNQIHYTDKESLVHELTHTKIAAEGKQFSGRTAHEREMAEEFEVSKRMVKMGILDRNTEERRFGLSINTDTSNMSNEELNRLDASTASDTYKKQNEGRKHSYSDNRVEGFAKSLVTQMGYSSNKSIEGIVELSQYSPTAVIGDTLVNTVVGRKVIDRAKDIELFKQNVTGPGAKHWRDKMPDEYREYKDNNPVHNFITDLAEPTLFIGGIEAGLAVKGSKFIAPTMPKILSGASRLLNNTKVRQPIIKNALKASDEYVHVATKEIAALYGDSDKALYLSHIDDLTPSINFMDTSKGVFAARLKDGAKVFNPATATPRELAKLRKGITNELMSEGMPADRAKNLASKRMESIRNPKLKHDETPKLTDSLGNWQAYEDGSVVKAMRKLGYDAYDFIEDASIGAVSRTAKAKGVLNLDALESFVNKATGHKVPFLQSATASAPASTLDSIVDIPKVLASNKSAMAPTVLKDSTVVSDATNVAEKFKIDNIPYIGKAKQLWDKSPKWFKSTIKDTAGSFTLFKLAQHGSDFTEKKYLERTQAVPETAKTAVEQHEDSQKIANNKAVENLNINAAELSANNSKKEARNIVRQEVRNVANYAFNPSADTNTDIDSMRLKSSELQIPFDLLSKQNGEAELKSHYRKKGLSSAEIKTRIGWDKERFESFGSPSNNTSGVNTGIPNSPNRPIISSINNQDEVFTPLDKVSNIDMFRERYDKAVDAYGRIKVPLMSGDASIGIDAKAFNKDTNGGYSATIGSQTTYFGSQTDQARIIEEAKGYIKNPMPKYSLADEAVKAPASTTDAIINTNDKLIAALDNLRTSIEKSSTGGSTEKSSMQVAVNAPITVSGSSSQSQDVSLVVTKLCSDFFNTEFNARFIKAVQTVNVNG